MADARRAADSVSKVYDAIRRMATDFELRPEARINEVELAHRFSVSRTPVREALNRLVIEGLITLVPNKGFYCRSLTKEEIFNLFEVRAGLEHIAAKSAIKRASDETLGAIARSWEEVAAKTDLRQSQDLAILDEMFHEQIAAASNNAELLNALRLVNVRLRFARRIVIELRDRDGVFSDHRRIAKALRSRDATKAGEILEKHIMLSRDDALKVAREGFARIYAGAES
ncbi:MAG: GntR family transcriptional regulator [Hyphomicrobiaceae bacterium]